MTETMFRILVIEDDAGLRDVLRALLEAEGYRVILAETGRRALIEARSHKPDAVLVDLGLPDRDGQDVIRRIREFSPVPIIVLSARTMESEKVLALDGGADDYVTKPFGSTELLARVRAALRRSARSTQQPETLRIGELEINLGTREAAGPAGTLHFTPHPRGLGPRPGDGHPRPALLRQVAAREDRTRSGASALSRHRTGRRLQAHRGAMNNDGS